MDNTFPPHDALHEWLDDNFGWQYTDDELDAWTKLLRYQLGQAAQLLGKGHTEPLAMIVTGGFGSLELPMPVPDVNPERDAIARKLIVDALGE